MTEPLSPTAETQWWRRVLPAAAFQLVSIAAVVLLKSAANAQVLTRFHAEVLPYLYILAAALAALVTGVLAQRGLLSRWGPVGSAVGGTVLAVLTASGVQAGVGFAALASYLFSETFSTFLAVTFWAAAARAFDPRESRRAFSLLSGVGMVGGTLGGLASQLLARQWGAGVLPFVAAGLLAVGALVYRGERQVGAAPSRSARERDLSQRARETEPLWAYLRTQPFARNFALFVLSLALVTAFVDFLFRERAARALDENELAALFGNVQLWVGLISAGFQLLWAERVLRRVGILRYLAGIPVVMGTLAGAALVTDALWPAYLLKLAENAISYSLLPVAVQLLYAPVPDDVRDGFRRLMDGGVKKGGVVLAGLVLAGAGGLAESWLLPFALVALAAAAGFMLLRLRPGYVEALSAHVTGGERALPMGASSEPLLAAALRASEPERVLHAVSLMEGAGLSLRPHLPALLAHAHERVNERGVQLAAELGAEEALPYVERLVTDGPRRPRGEAVWALARLAPARARAELPALLTHEDIGVRCAAIGALLTLEGMQDLQQSSQSSPEPLLDGAPVLAAKAEQALASLTHAGLRATAAERREVAKLLGRLCDERHAPKLLPYLEDGDASVRRVAIAAVGEGGYVSLAPRLLAFLTWRDERRPAREALAAMGNRVLPLLESALNDRSRPALLRYELPRVLRQLGTQSALEALLFSNVRDDAFLHYRIGVALSQLREEAPSLQADEQWVMEAVKRRRDVYRRLVDAFRDLQVALGPRALLTRAVGDRLDQSFELSFWLLGLLHPPRPLRRIHQHLVGTDSRRRAYALELFEHLVPERHREALTEQIEAHHRLLPPGAAGRLSWHLSLLCHSDDGVLRACARQVARERGLWTLPLQDDDMSEHVLKRLFALEGVEMFAQCDVDDLNAVAALAREQSFRAGERIYEQGDPGDALYVILTGRVRADTRGGEVLTLGANEAFGEVSLLDGSPRPTSITTLEETTVLVIDRRDFLDLISDRPELLKGVFRAAMRQYAQVIQQPRRVTGELPAPPPLAVVR